MTRKTLCIIFAAVVAVCSIAAAFAAEKDNSADYDAAVELLAAEGLTPVAETALTEGRGVAAGVEQGLMARESALPLWELGARTMLEQQQAARAAEEEAQTRIRRSAYLAVYDGALLIRTATLRKAPDADSAALRTLVEGKAAKLLDITEEGWYKVSFGGKTGYIRPEDCRGVRYSDYEGTAAAMDVTEAMIAYARTWLGTPYVYGGSSKAGTDCSGFTMAVFGEVGYSLSHGARSQYNAAEHVSVAERQRGDLVFFTSPGESGITHVGIYLGNGAFIHASCSQGVTIDNINNAYYSACYYGAGRIISE